MLGSCNSSLLMISDVRFQSGFKNEPFYPRTQNIHSTCYSTSRCCLIRTVEISPHTEATVLSGPSEADMWRIMCPHCCTSWVVKLLKLTLSIKKKSESSLENWIIWMNFVLNLQNKNRSVSIRKAVKLVSVHMQVLVLVLQVSFYTCENDLMPGSAHICSLTPRRRRTSNVHHMFAGSCQILSLSRNIMYILWVDQRRGLNPLIGGFSAH